MVRILVALLVVLMLAPTAPASATSIVAVVNGSPITSYDVGQRERLLRLTGTQGALSSMALDELIDEKLQLNAARQANVTIDEGDVDRAIGEIAGRVKLSAGQLGQALSQQGVNIKTLRDRIRAQIAFNRLVRARFQAESQVTEQDLVAALLKDDTLERQIETAEYTLQQVIVAMPENPSAQRLAEANRIASKLRAEFNGCANGIELVKKTRNVVVRPFGRRTESELTNDVQDALKDVPVGKLAAPIETPRGLVLFAVCDKKTMQSTNAAMKALEPELANERGEQFSKQYLRQLRRDAVIERR
ncbi:SurA N-terminal domain-containing protein [Acuticoccus sp. M5D2P5]|uniref:peptidylprolyl isomerase n=1 Tax=Acuticoccus kalidii TaxID=2910977 RepID=UPI001F18584B|nr:SurA N-terminal domain-containing protein [Acuticoccus kalidii]MCF3935539.1 SurA N-terminal domain-containing protein [Acuticoccus kalidii]